MITWHCLNSSGAGVRIPASALCPVPSQNWNCKLESHSSPHVPHHLTPRLSHEDRLAGSPYCWPWNELQCSALLLLHASLCHWIYLLPSYQTTCVPVAALISSVTLLITAHLSGIFCPVNSEAASRCWLWQHIRHQNNQIPIRDISNPFAEPLYSQSRHNKTEAEPVLQCLLTLNDRGFCPEHRSQVPGGNHVNL